VEGEPGEHWTALDRTIRRSETEVVALPLPGVAGGPDWLASARVALEGDRVAAVVGAGAPAGAPPKPLLLTSRRLLDAPYMPFGQPSRYLLLRRPLYEALGGFESAAAELGPQGPVVDLLERALDAGYVVAYRDTPGLNPPQLSEREWRQTAWHRHQARGGLMLRRAVGDKGWLWFVWRGLVPLAADLWKGIRIGNPRPAHAAGTAVAFLNGCLIAARRGVGR
jgi:hypothetical protein